MDGDGERTKDGVRMMFVTAIPVLIAANAFRFLTTDEPPPPDLQPPWWVVLLVVLIAFVGSFYVVIKLVFG